MVNALHADQWLENHPETAAAERDAFYTDTGAWQQRTVEQGVDAARQAVAGLAGRRQRARGVQCAASPVTTPCGGFMSRVCCASIPRRRVLVAALAWGAGAVPVLAQDTARLVLKGHDPVAYFTLGAPTKGDPRYSHEWDGGRYLFVSAEHRAMFIADPERYAPQFGGFCTGFMSRGIRSEGDPGGWVIHEDRLYVFGQARFREVARSDPAFLPSRLEGARKNWQVLRTGQ